MLRDFIQDSKPENARLYSIFKVSREDQIKQEEAARPPKREKSPEDPYFKKLEYKPYHNCVHRTNEIMRKLEPYESRRHTDGKVVEDFLDQNTRFYTNVAPAKKLDRSYNPSGISNKSSPGNRDGSDDEGRPANRHKGMDSQDHSRLSRINKDLFGNGRLLQVEGETDYFEA